MVCKHCGQQLTSNSTICMSCGKPVEEADKFSDEVIDLDELDTTPIGQAVETQVNPSFEDSIPVAPELEQIPTAPVMNEIPSMPVNAQMESPIPLQSTTPKVNKVEELMKPQKMPEVVESKEKKKKVKKERISDEPPKGLIVGIVVAVFLITIIIVLSVIS